jgi:hypothetical protein
MSKSIFFSNSSKYAVKAFRGIVMCVVLFILILAPTISNAQTGPGGVGSTDGASSLEIWLKGDDGLVVSGSDVTQWQDRSGNGRNMPSFNTPQIASAKYNGIDAVNFTSSQQERFYINSNLPLQSGDNSITFVAVWETKNPGALEVIQEQNSSSLVVGNRACMIGIGPKNWGFNGEGNDAHSLYTNVLVNSPYIGVITRNGTSVRGWCNGTYNTATLGSSTGVGAGGYSLGYKLCSFSEFLNGHIGEVMVYSDPLNTAQVILLNNYLSAKYNISLTASDIYSGDTPSNNNFDSDVAGIARISGTTIIAGNSAGFIIQNSAFLLNDGDSILAGHNVATNSIVTSDLPATIVSRWERSWFLDIKDAGTTSGLVNLIFDFSDAGAGSIPSSSHSYYNLLTRSGTTGTFSTVAATSTTVSGDHVTFNINASTLISSNNYTLGLGVDNEAPFSTATIVADYSSTTTIMVDFISSDTFSGLNSTSLWVKIPGSAFFTDTGLTRTGISGAFTYSAGSGDGTYEFYTIAIDNASNTESAPGIMDDSIELDTEAPDSTLPALSDITLVGTVISLPFTASDSGSGVASTTLWVKIPGAGAFVDAGILKTGNSGTFNYTATDGDGIYKFATKATDNATNSEADPTIMDVVVFVNTVENSDFTCTLSSSDEMTTFPMTNELDIVISITGATPGGTITVSRTIGDTAPVDFNAASLINEYLTITGSGLGTGWTATITWNYDPASEAGLVGDLDTVFQIDGGTHTRSYSVTPEGRTLIITGVTSFSDWYAGNHTSEVMDWKMF